MGGSQPDSLERQERIKDLIDSGNIKDLLKEYVRLKDSTDEDAADLQTQISTYLEKKEQDVVSLVGSDDNDVAVNAIVYYGDKFFTYNRNQLIEVFKEDRNEEVYRAILDASLNKENVGFINLEYANKLFFEEVHKREAVESLAELLAQALSWSEQGREPQKAEYIKNYLLGIKYPTCGPLARDKCDQELRKAGNKYFIAYAFKNKKFLETVKRALSQSLPDFEGEDASISLKQGHILCKVCEMIRVYRFGIFDLSGNLLNKLPNPNVLLELGLAFGIGGKKIVICIKRGTKLVSDIAGLDRIEYKNYRELEEKLKTRIPNFLYK